MKLYRTFQSGDEGSIVQLWNDVMQTDPISQVRFRNQVLLDVNFDPEGLIIAVDGERIIGAMLAITRKVPMLGGSLETDNGWITFFMVHQDVQNRGIGKGLLDRAILYLRKQGVSNVYFSSYAPNYFLPGLDEKAYPRGYAFLQKEGFSQLYSPVAMHRTLTDYHYPASVNKILNERVQEGYIVESVKDGDLHALIQFANDAFNPDWGRAIRDGLMQGMNPAQIVVAKKADRIVGFAMYGGYEGILERFGPFGVAASEQGKGLGRVLLHNTLFLMKQQSIQGAWFLWTSETSAAGHLYAKNGFLTYRRFHVMVKKL